MGIEKGVYSGGGGGIFLEGRIKVLKKRVYSGREG